MSCLIHGGVQLVHSVEENVQWTVGNNNEPSYNLKFKDVTKIEKLLSMVNSLTTAATIQANPPVVNSVFESVSAKQQKEVDNPRQSEMAVEGFSHKIMDQTEENMAHFLATQQSVLYEDPYINLSEADAGVDQESENVTVHPEPNVANDHLFDMNDPQQETSKVNIVTGSVATHSVKGNVHCSETDNEIINFIETTQSIRTVIVPPNLNLNSHYQEVSSIATLCSFVYMYQVISIA